MRLHQFAYSPFAAKVRKCLELKGLAFEVVEVPYLDRRELVALSGGIHVPVLEDGGRVVADSQRITAYLDQAYRPSLREEPLAEVLEGWAEGPLEDVAFRIAAPWLEARFAELQGGRDDARALFRVIKERRYGPGCLEQWRAGEPALIAQLASLLRPVGAALATRPFVLGQAATLADAAIRGQLHMIEFVRPGLVEDRLPALQDWYERLADLRGRAGARG
ncbi:MAG: glutathione S-transferase [Anaeromyxobacter sp.]